MHSTYSTRVHYLLIVEDDTTYAEILINALHKHLPDCQIDHAENGQDALDFLNAQPPPALILLDMYMPVKDGFEVLHELKTNPARKQIPVIALTVAANEEIIDKCYEQGANAYVIKPKTNEELDACVEKISTFWNLVANFARAV